MAELEEYKLILADRPKMKKVEFLSSIAENTPFETEAELESWIKRTDADIKRKQRKAMGEDPEPEEEPTFPPVDRPDEELNEEELKEKRKQRLMKAGWEARVKVREEKKREKERMDEEQRLEELERATDIKAWSARLREEQEVGNDVGVHKRRADGQAVINRMNERKKRRAQLGDRKSVAAQNRMKSIANLAAENNTGKKRKKNGDGE